MMKITNTCPLMGCADSTKREKAMKVRFTALNMSSMPMRMPTTLRLARATYEADGEEDGPHDEVVSQVCRHPNPPAPALWHPPWPPAGAPTRSRRAARSGSAAPRRWPAAVYGKGPRDASLQSVAAATPAMVPAVRPARIRAGPWRNVSALSRAARGVSIRANRIRTEMAPA